MIIAQQNGRSTIGAPDKVFSVSARAKARIAEIGRENVMDSTIGALLDDEGKLIVLNSVMEAIRGLTPDDYAAYAPILGLPEYLDAVKRSIFLDGIPEGTFVEACYTPGGTGAIRNGISAYTKSGDKVLTSDWRWSPYGVIAAELGRELETFTLFDAERKFNADAFAAALAKILQTQEQTVVILNTPAHNPTGYALTDDDWEQVLQILRGYPDKKIGLLVDIAYLDFSGDPHVYRQFLQKLVGLPAHILPLLAFSASKGFTMYGMRCGALLCMAPTAEIAAEFQAVMSVECRASWSNGNRSAMTAVAKVVNDATKFAALQAEREIYHALLNRRGEIFSQQAAAVGLELCPYDSGFFIVVPCQHAEAVGERLQEMDVFTIPVGDGLRISVASISTTQCQYMPEKIKAAIDACMSEQKRKE